MNDIREETTIARERMHWGVFIPSLLVPVLVGLLITLPVLVVVHVTSKVIVQVNPQTVRPAFGPVTLIAFLPPVLIGLVLLFVTWALYSKSNITLTNRRLIFRTGLLLSRVTGELPLENVEAIILSEPLLGRFFGYGTVIVTSLGGLQFPFRYIASPQNFHATLQAAVVAAKSSVKPVTKSATPSAEDDSRYMPKR